jgi:hypothetical protein
MFVLNPAEVVFALYNLLCVGAGVWRGGPDLSIQPNRLGFLPEDGDILQSLKCCFK